MTIEIPAFVPEFDQKLFLNRSRSVKHGLTYNSGWATSGLGLSLQRMGVLIFLTSPKLPIFVALMV